MAGDRASILSGSDEDDFDITGFAPATLRAAPERKDVANLGAAAGYASREPVAQRRHMPRTGRSMQLNLKATPETVDLIRQLSDEQGWPLAETFERAMLALQRELLAGK